MICEAQRRGERPALAGPIHLKLGISDEGAMKIRELKHNHSASAKPYRRASAWLHAKWVEKATAEGYFDDLDEDGSLCCCDLELTEHDMQSLKCAACGREVHHSCRTAGEAEGSEFGGLTSPITGLRQTAKRAVAIPVDWLVGPQCH